MPSHDYDRTGREGDAGGGGVGGPDGEGDDLPCPACAERPGRPCREEVRLLIRLCDPEIADALFAASLDKGTSRRDRDLALRALALIPSSAR